jgi:hypothetical protein
MAKDEIVPGSPMEQIQRYDDEAPVLAGAARSRLRYRRLVARCAAIVGGGVLLLVAFVAVIDPYHLYGFVDSRRLNHVKPLPEQYREQIKLAQATAARPDLVLLGNSRVEVGLDPDSPQLSGHGRSAYNMALAGATLAVNERMYAALRADAAPAAMAVIGVEFLDFLVKPDSAPPAAPAAGPFPWQWRFDTLLSVKSMTDALRTVRLQKAADPATMTQRGQTPQRDYNRYARAQGYDAIFQQKAAENARNIVRKPHNLFVAGTDGSPSIDRLRALLDTMARDRTEVHLVIYPYHAQMMAMFDEAGLAPTMEAWKQVLVREVDAVRGRYPSARIGVWDFSGYAAMRCERIPAPGDTRTATRWYWDAGHFKSALGERMLQRILGDETPFGVRLAAGNLDANRRRIAAERAQCAAAYPQVFTGAHDLVAAARASSR